MYHKLFCLSNLWLLFFISSCSNFANDKNVQVENFISKGDSLKKIDTLSIKPVVISAKPKIFETAFFEGSEVKDDSSFLKFYAVEIGKINIESGKVIACDPIVKYNEKPFSQIFPIGKFPVQLSIAQTKDDQRIAFSRIVFSEKPIIKWEFAVQDGQKQISIFGEEMYSYGVDGGIGLFIDEKANEVFNKESGDDNLWAKVFNGEIEKHSHENWSYLLYNFNNHNLAAFSTGYGDGHYATYIGFDKDGHPCKLLTDFNLVNWQRLNN